MNLPLRPQRHFVFANTKPVAVSVPKRPWAPAPFDELTFYPDKYFRMLRCKVTDALCFDSDKAVGKFSDHVAKTWRCEHCGTIHFESYPTDSGGQSSGKHLRAYYWNLRRGKRIDVEKDDKTEPCKLFLKRNGFNENI